MREIKAIVLHHSGGKNWGNEDGREVRAFCIREGNSNGNAWYPTVYHYLIAKNGKVWNDAADNVVVPHCGLDYNEYWINNQNTISISVIGDYEREVMPDSQYNATLSVMRALKTRYPKAFFKLHRELVNTDCPGKNYPFDKLMKDLEVCMTYKDVDPKAWYFKAVSWMIQKGFIKGNEKGLIQPLKYITKAELAQIMYNKAEKENTL